MPRHAVPSSFVIDLTGYCSSLGRHVVVICSRRCNGSANAGTPRCNRDIRFYISFPDIKTCIARRPTPFRSPTNRTHVARLFVRSFDRRRLSWWFNFACIAGTQAHARGIRAIAWKNASTAATVSNVFSATLLFVFRSLRTGTIILGGLFYCSIGGRKRGEEHAECAIARHKFDPYELHWFTDRFRALD